MAKMAKMAKKEFKIGETFQCGLIKLKVVESDVFCDDCYFRETGCINLKNILGLCSLDREDKTNVIFVEVEE